MRRFLSIAMAIILVVVLMPAYVVPVSAAENVVTEWTGEEDDLYLYHEHTKGSGIPIIIMPVHFGASDLAEGGRLQTASVWAAEVVLDETDSFFNGFDEYLDIYVYIKSDAVSPVPTSGYVSVWGEKWSKAVELASTRLGKDSSVVRMVYLGNSDNTGQTAGQVGGHAYGRQGAMLSWGNDSSGNAWQDNPPYWARHEFFGHGFAGFADEYEIDAQTGDTNLVVSETKPANAMVPWYDFIGYTETVNGVEREIGIYTHNNADYHGWFPVETGFMHSADPFVSQYHKWVVYRTAMEYAGTPKTLDDFCTMQGITLNPPVPATAVENLFLGARDGGTCQLSDDVTLSIGLDIQNDFTLDLNGQTVTVNVNEIERSAVSIGTGKTLTVNDSAGGGKLIVTCGTGAGIRTTGATLVVNGGTLDITGGDWSAGIGGRQTSGGTVIINGGTVNATGHMQSAGIGGGSGGSAGNIVINGGTVNATGGTNTWSAIGNGTGGGSGSVTINGGSVYAASINPAPTNGSNPVYLTTLTLAGFPNTQIATLTSPSGYGATDLTTDANGKLYFWLPQGAMNVALTTASGVELTGAVTVAANNSNAATLNPGAGTKIPVTVLSQPANTSVTEGSSAKFTVVASGYPAPTYQWQVSTDGTSWSDVSGATSATLTLTNVTIADNNGSKYRCIVTNTTEQVNTVTSNTATLTVKKATASGGGIPNTDAGDMRRVFAYILSISTGVLGAALVFKRKQNL